MSVIPQDLLERIREAKKRGLDHLDLTNHQFCRGELGLKEIPGEVFEMTHLRSLNLRRNCLSSLPNAIGDLKQLTELNLSSNSLSQLPDSLSKLHHLSSLDLSFNHFEEIPEAVSFLQGLASLDLSCNELTSINQSVFRLSDLRFLDLSFNRLQRIPDEISLLKALQTLRLSNNLLTDLPAALYELPNLSHLELRNSSKDFSPLLEVQNTDCVNRIKELDQKILEMPSLKVLALDSDSIELPPREIVDKGLNAIMDYFRQLETEGSDYVYEAKLLIVGEAGAGKTTLANKIKDPGYELQFGESTRGITVDRWAFPMEGNRSFRVNIWDFGGQAIYYATHQFFLTKRSLYLLVADNRKQDTDFHYWLNVVELLSENSPLFIIKNEKEDWRREINEPQLRADFANLEKTLATNLATNRGLAEIVTEVKHRISHLPHVRDRLPKTWIKIRGALENDPRDYINREAYAEICREHGFVSRKDQMQLSNYFHDLGVCLHFQQDPLLRKTIILKPKWGTDAVYKILDNQKVIDNLGRFDRNDLKEIWHEPEYSDMEDELLQLMINFNLVYQIPEKDLYIAPQLLSERKPNYEWDTTDNLVLKYEYQFMPQGIMTRFIVRMHKHIAEQNHVWRSGVVLERQGVNTKRPARAEVVENYKTREIIIRVAGDRPKELLTIITWELDKIHDDFQRLVFKKLIPCNCGKCLNGADRHFYEFTVLQNFVANKQEQIQCPIGFGMVSVAGLLDDVKGTPKTDIFLSYTHKDKEWQTRFKTMLRPLQEATHFSVWADDNIPAGANWKDQIEQAIANSKVAVLLISPDYLNSDFIIQDELPLLLDAEKHHGLTILWIPISRALVERTEIAKYQAASDPSKPLNGMSHEEANETLKTICERVEQLVRP